MNRSILPRFLALALAVSLTANAQEPSGTSTTTGGTSASSGTSSSGTSTSGTTSGGPAATTTKPSPRVIPFPESTPAATSPSADPRPRTSSSRMGTQPRTTTGQPRTSAGQPRTRTGTPSTSGARTTARRPVISSSGVGPTSNRATANSSSARARDLAALEAFNLNQLDLSDQQQQDLNRMLNDLDRRELKMWQQFRRSNFAGLQRRARGSLNDNPSAAAAAGTTTANGATQIPAAVNGVGVTSGTNPRATTSDTTAGTGTSTTAGTEPSSTTTANGATELPAITNGTESRGTSTTGNEATAGTGTSATDTSTNGTATTGIAGDRSNSGDAVTPGEVNSKTTSSTDNNAASTDTTPTDAEVQNAFGTREDRNRGNHATGSTGPGPVGGIGEEMDIPSIEGNPPLLGNATGGDAVRGNREFDMDAFNERLQQLEADRLAAIRGQLTPEQLKIFNRLNREQNGSGQAATSDDLNAGSNPTGTNARTGRNSANRANANNNNNNRRNANNNRNRRTNRNTANGNPGTVEDSGFGDDVGNPNRRRGSLSDTPGTANRGANKGGVNPAPPTVGIPQGGTPGTPSAKTGTPTGPSGNNGFTEDLGGSNSAGPVGTSNPGGSGNGTGGNNASKGSGGKGGK